MATKTKEKITQDNDGNDKKNLSFYEYIDLKTSNTSSSVFFVSVMKYKLTIAMIEETIRYYMGKGWNKVTYETDPTGDFLFFQK
jgi:hypothetical protein